MVQISSLVKNQATSWANLLVQTNLLKEFPISVPLFLVSFFEITYSFKLKKKTFFIRKIISTVGRLLAKTNRCLTHFSPVSHFYNPWKRQKIIDSPTFPWGIVMWHWTKMG